MKGIVLAGGTGSRLFPATLAVSKQLLPVFDKPMIYYPLGVLMLAGIREILVISTPADLPRFESLLGDGIGLWHSASPMPSRTQPRGLAEAFIVGRDFVGGDSVALILGDNIFYGAGLIDLVRRRCQLTTGATVFAYAVEDPERYGVVEFDAETGAPFRSRKSRRSRKSNWAVTGLYFYDNDVARHRRGAQPVGARRARDHRRQPRLSRARAAARRTARPRLCLARHRHARQPARRRSFVRTIENRQGMKVMCLEEIALELGYLTPDDLVRRAEQLGKTDYADYLLRRAGEHRACLRSGRLSLTGVLEIRPRRFGDERGFFSEVWTRATGDEAGHRRAFRPGQSFLLEVTGSASRPAFPGVARGAGQAGPGGARLGLRRRRRHSSRFADFRTVGRRHPLGRGMEPDVRSRRASRTAS